MEISIKYQPKSKMFIIAAENKLIGKNTKEYLQKIYPDFNFDIAMKNPKQWFIC